MGKLMNNLKRDLNIIRLDDFLRKIIHWFAENSLWILTSV